MSILTEKFVQYGKQQISEDDIEAVVDVLRSDLLTQGPVTVAFEDAISKYCDVNYSVTVNSATSGLHLALRALDVGSGDIVWTSAITFVATSNAALYCGAEVDFVDIDKNTINICVKSLKHKLEDARKKNRLPKVVIAVHMGGLPSEMQKIHMLSLEYGFEVVEDASHAVGASYEDVKVGKCQYSKLCIFSLHPVKIITSGEGGVITTNDSKLAGKLSKLRTHGIMRAESNSDNDTEELWNYFQDELGYNYRMSEIHAALGLSQSKKIDEFVNRRSKIASQYKSIFSGLPIRLQKFDYSATSSWHLMIIRLNLSQINTSKVDVYEYFLRNRIQANFHYIPVYRHPFYQRMGFKKGYCPEAEKYFKDALSIPLHPGLTSDDFEKSVSTLKEALNV